MISEIDTTKSLLVTMSIVDESTGGGALLEPIGTIVLSPAECAALIDGWLLVSKKWRGTFKRSLSRQEGMIASILDYGTFVRMLGCHGRPCSDEAASTIVKLFQWKSRSIPKTEASDSMWHAGIVNAGKRCVFTLLVERGEGRQLRAAA